MHSVCIAFGLERCVYAFSDSMDRPGALAGRCSAGPRHLTAGYLMCTRIEIVDPVQYAADIASGIPAGSLEAPLPPTTPPNISPWQFTFPSHTPEIRGDCVPGRSSSWLYRPNSALLCECARQASRPTVPSFCRC